MGYDQHQRQHPEERSTLDGSPFLLFRQGSWSIFSQKAEKEVIQLKDELESFPFYKIELILYFPQKRFFYIKRRWFKERIMPADETDRWDRSYLKESQQPLACRTETVLLDRLTGLATLCAPSCYGKKARTDSTAPSHREPMGLRYLKRQFRVLASCLKSGFKETRSFSLFIHSG